MYSNAKTLEKNQYVCIALFSNISSREMTATSTQKAVSIKSESLNDLGSAAKDLLSFCGETKVITFSEHLEQEKQHLSKAIFASSFLTFKFW